jgi:hypothetical protein
MKAYLALTALPLLVSGCAAVDRAMMTNEGDFDIVDAAAPGAAPDDYRLSFSSKANLSYDLSSPQGRLAFAETLSARAARTPPS